MTIEQQLAQEYVGEIVEMYDIDLRPIGVNVVHYLSPHSETAFNWQTRTYSPFPINITGLDRSYNAAPGRVELQASTSSSLMTSLMIQHGDLVGAHVTKWRTLSMFLDGRPDANPTQHWPVEKYIILQRKSLGPDGVVWVLGSNIDKPGSVLPRRQCLKDDISRQGLWCPGMSRWRVN